MTSIGSQASTLTVESLIASFAESGYIADRGLATSVLLAMRLGKPLLLEGEVGVGKTELAKTLASMFERDLIRLQCYEGIDMSQALYELGLRPTDAAHPGPFQADAVEPEELFGPRFLLERPLLAAVRAGDRAILLVDEVDRADDEFEAFLLELLGDFQVTIPEIGTVRATERPLVILTSNRTRELHDALKRRCLYTWIGFPTQEREIAIVRSRVPQASAALTAQVVAAVHRLRELELEKVPGVAETIDWTTSLTAIDAHNLTETSAIDTLGAIIKDRDDLDYTTKNIQDVIT